MKTHPNFKTAIPEFSNVETIYKYVGEALWNQCCHIKTTTPWENKREFQNFKIYPEDIDRLYYIKYDRHDRFNCIVTRYRLVVRIDYNGRRGCCRKRKCKRKHKRKQEHEHENERRERREQEDHLYVELSAGYLIHTHGLFERKPGFIFISRDVSLFMNLVVLENPQSSIYEFLAEDGIIIDQQQEEYYRTLNSTGSWKKPPSLKYFCHNTVYVNKELLSNYYREVMPNILSNNLDYFVILRQAREARKAPRCYSCVLRSPEITLLLISSWMDLDGFERSYSSF